MDLDTRSPVYNAPTVARLLGNTRCELPAFAQHPESLAGFVTFFDPGWSILQLRAAVKGRGRIFYQPFATVEAAPRYRQVRMSPVPGSTRKTYAEQVALVPEGEEVPTARVVVVALAIHFLATGERLLPNLYVRCADQSSRGRRVYVGDFDTGGLDVSGILDDGRFDNLGLASSRKF